MRQVNADWPTVTGVGAGSWNRNCLGRVRCAWASCISCKLTTSSPPYFPCCPLPNLLSSLHFVPFHYKHLKTFILFEDFHFQSVEMSHSRMGAPRVSFDSVRFIVRYLPCPLCPLCGAFNNNEKWLPHVFDFYFFLSFHFTSLDLTQLCQLAT